MSDAYFERVLEDYSNAIALRQPDIADRRNDVLKYVEAMAARAGGGVKHEHVVAWRILQRHRDGGVQCKYTTGPTPPIRRGTWEPLILAKDARRWTIDDSVVVEGGRA